MAYTVKEVSTLSGVSVRTLHYYEEIGLLQPAFYGSNGYRYYEEKELLILQQILFYKELGLKLRDIHLAFSNEKLSPLSTLCSQRKSLLQEREKIDTLLQTIDQTIEYLKGKKKMENREFFDGFSLVKKATKEAPYFAAEEKVLSSLKDTKELTPTERQQVSQKANALFSQITDYLEQGKAPSSNEVQTLIEKHYHFAEEFHHLNDEVYQALAHLYVHHPEYRKQLDPIHPHLAQFLSEAMKAFVS